MGLKHFDNAKTTRWLSQYLRSPSQSLRDQILLEASKLISAATRKMRVQPKDYEDIQQECFVKVLTSLPHYKGPGKAFPFLWAVICNSIRNSLRNRSRRAINTAAQPQEAYSTPVLPSPVRSTHSRKIARLFRESPQAAFAYFPELREVYEIVGAENIEEFLTNFAGQKLEIPSETRMAKAVSELGVYFLLAGLSKREAVKKRNWISKRIRKSPVEVLAIFHRAEGRLKRWAKKAERKGK